MPEPEHRPSVSSALCYRDPKKALRWLEEAFGFEGFESGSGLAGGESQAVRDFVVRDRATDFQQTADGGDAGLGVDPIGADTRRHGEGRIAGGAREHDGDGRPAFGGGPGGAVVSVGDDRGAAGAREFAEVIEVLRRMRG